VEAAVITMRCHAEGTLAEACHGSDHTAKHRFA
jgi:hypothetical protein